MIATTIKMQVRNIEQKQVYFECKRNNLLSAFATKGSNRVEFDSIEQ